MTARPRRLRTRLGRALGLGLASALLCAACTSAPASPGRAHDRAATTTTTGSGAPASASGAPGPADVALGETVSPLRWHACDVRFRCATLAVPVSYRQFDLGTLHLAVVSLPATGRSEGDLVLNPGGPGASGVSFLEGSWQSFPASLRDHETLVSFDPRGVGASDPVTCVTPAGMRAWLAVDPSPSTPAQVAQVVAATKAFVAGCVQRSPKGLLAHLSTLDTARDMDRLRAALGERQLTYLGFSYGTYLGSLFAEHFPHRVRAMVLDGALDPALGVVALDRAQAAGFQGDLESFFRWCDANASCALSPKAAGGVPVAGGAGAAYNRLVTELSSGASIPGTLQPAYGGNVEVDLGTAETGVASALYTTSTWPLLATAISDALQGNASLLAALAYSYAGLQQDGQYQNILEAFVAISCLDRPAPHRLTTYESLARSFAQAAPDFGASEAWGTLPCAYWPVPPQGKPAPIHAPGAPTILVVGSTGDPATPYAWAVALAHQLDHARLLTRVGEGHTGYFASSCVRSWVDRYVQTLSLPPPGTVCQSN